jgi:hypothetical protein
MEVADCGPNANPCQAATVCCPLEYTCGSGDNGCPIGGCCLKGDPAQRPAAGAPESLPPPTSANNVENGGGSKASAPTRTK